MAEQNCMLSCVDDFVTTLESFKTSLDDTFKQLEGKSQQYVDEVIVNDINPSVNAKLASLRAGLISSMQSMYQGAIKMYEKITPVANANPTDLSGVISAVMAIKDFIIGAYQFLVEFMTLLPEHIVKLNNAITSLVAYSPPYSLNADKLDIKMEPISMGDITGG